MEEWRQKIKNWCTEVADVMQEDAFTCNAITCINIGSSEKSNLMSLLSIEFPKELNVLNGDVFFRPTKDFDWDRVADLVARWNDGLSMRSAIIVFRNLNFKENLSAETARQLERLRGIAKEQDIALIYEGRINKSEKWLSYVNVNTVSAELFCSEKIKANKYIGDFFEEWLVEKERKVLKNGIKETKKYKNYI